MSYSVDPPQLLSVAERLRGCFDDLDELVASVRRATDAVSHSLGRAAAVRTAFTELADPRVDLARRLLARGRAAIEALQSAALAYLTADDEMATHTDSCAARVDGLDGGNPYDPTIFGKRRL